MFTLLSVEYSTLGRLTLIFSDTVHKTNPANTLPSNFIITGGATVGGNFQVFTNTISFDIGLAPAGKVFDIQVQNIVSSQGETVDFASGRQSFYFGIGVVDPYFLNQIQSIGSLYIISDSALIGKI